MPLVIELGHFDAAPFDRVSDDNYGRSVRRNPMGPMEGIYYRRDIVAIHFDHFPAKSPPFFRIRLDTHQVPGKAFRHYLVVIHDGDDVVQMVMGSRHRRFPHVALI